MRRALILACSATKARSCPGGKIPALERYDGPAWRTLRAYLRSILPAKQLELEIFALSAEHGLITGETRIADYDRRMTIERARQLVPSVADQLAQTLLEWEGEIFAFGGGVYRDCLETARVIAEQQINRGIEITYSSGGIGEQLGQLKAWIRREA